ncbi:hypothetical protein B0H19DRAFT_1249280 [Mycena capillaripes]|nr:hypothetical protein B0H19DRAFT_1249280 [Mycena capillaripes]
MHSAAFRYFFPHTFSPPLHCKPPVHTPDDQKLDRLSVRRHDQMSKLAGASSAPSICNNWIDAVQLCVPSSTINPDPQPSLGRPESSPARVKLESQALRIANLASLYREPPDTVRCGLKIPAPLASSAELLEFEPRRVDDLIARKLEEPVSREISWEANVNATAQATASARSVDVCGSDPDDILYPETFGSPVYGPSVNFCFFFL